MVMYFLSHKRKVNTILNWYKYNLIINVFLLRNIINHEIMTNEWNAGDYKLNNNLQLIVSFAVSVNI